MSDLISRQDAIDVLAIDEKLLKRVLDYMDVVGDEREKYEWGLGLIESYIFDLKQLPSAQPERPKGEWVGVHAYCNHKNEEAKVNGKSERYLPSGMVIGVYCNQCWCRADKKSDFCPNCGADMRQEERDYERGIEQVQHDMLYEPTYNSEDGSM